LEPAEQMGMRCDAGRRAIAIFPPFWLKWFGATILVGNVVAKNNRKLTKNSSKSEKKKHQQLQSMLPAAVVVSGTCFSK